MDMTSLLLALLLSLLAAACCIAVGFLLGRRRASGDDAVVDLAPVEGALDRLARRLDEAETLRRTDQATLRTEIGEHLRHVEATTDVLRRETGQLAAALGRADVRGRWGEAHLRRLVEASGLLERVHFIEQDVRSGDESGQRPDMVIDIGGGRQLVVDAKVPLAALLEAEATDDLVLRAELYARHARDVGQHADRLGSKDYWRRYDDSVESVVMFLPAESMLGVALREDPALLERAFARNVIIATPTTMLALLRTVGHVWRREALAENAREIHRLGRELHERLALLVDHVRKMGGSLDAAVAHYNRLVGSLDGRVLVSARRLAEHGMGDDTFPEVAVLTQRAREPRESADESREAAHESPREVLA
ncbi:MAG: DNA recombination protein RmuC [Candidatus Nanopelagicales bacterium]